MAGRLAHVLLNDWPYWLGRGLLTALGVRRIALESLADDPVKPFPAWPRLVYRDDGRMIVSVFAQTLIGWAIVVAGLALMAVFALGR